MLSDLAILEWIKRGWLEITPFNPDSLNPNSYDLHLSPNIYFFSGKKSFDFNSFTEPDGTVIIPEDGFLLTPEYFYLGCTIEFTCTYNAIPQIKAKSSVSRCGLDVISGGGFGDVGFSGHWTFTLKPYIPVKVYPKQPICQIYYTPITGQVKKDYKKTGRYNSSYNENPFPTLYKPKK